MDKRLAIAVALIAYLIFLGILYYEPTPQTPSCSKEARLCPDGSQVTRQLPSCDFAACPQEQVCDALNPCIEGDCVRFENLNYAVCHKGDPCQQCPTLRCQVLESYPLQVKCQA